MSFGATAPPASPKQVQYLLALVHKAGHADFREARRPLGLTQRQASGRFTRKEASELIDRLLGADGHDDGQRPPPTPSGGARADQMIFGGRRSGVEIAAEERLAIERDEIVRGLPAEVLVAELERRGWRVEGPA